MSESTGTSNSNATMWTVVVVIVAALILVVTLMVFKSNSVLNQTPVVAVTGTTTPQSSQDLSVEATTTTAVRTVASLTYAQALVKYADRRIQFDTACQAHPNNVTYKDNTGIMLDNRSSLPRTIKVGTNYNVKAYGFKIVILPDIYLKAKTLLVDCGASQNVATILVQE